MRKEEFTYEEINDNVILYVDKYIKLKRKNTVVTYGVCDDAKRHLPWAWTVSGFVRPLQYVPAEGLKSSQINS